jgi:hypothetical protein
MNNSWRLVTDLKLIIFSEDNIKKVCLIPTGKNYFEQIYKKYLKNCPYQEIELNDEISFNARIEKDLTLSILIDNVWYVVRNFSKNDSLGELVSQLDCAAGSFADKIEPIFSDNFPTEVKFTNEDMDTYDDCFDEMIRRVNCSMLKKTRKWIPGHRYDSEKETYIYLGKVFSHKKDKYSSDYLRGDDMVENYLVLRSVKGIKNNIDALTNKVIGDSDDNIQVLYKLPLMVDSGEKLEILDNRFEDFREKMIQMLNNNFQNNRKIIPLKEALSAYCYKSNKEVETISEFSKNILVQFIKSKLIDILVKFYNIEFYFPKEKTLSYKRTPEENVQALLQIFLDDIDRDNIIQSIYYPEQFKDLGIDLQSICEEVLYGFNINQVVFGDFNNYITLAEDYFKYHEIGNSRKVSTQFKDKELKKKNVTLEEILGEGELLDSIKELIGFVVSGNYLDVTKCEILNDNIMSITITLADLIKFRQDLTKNLKTEILRNKFQVLDIKFDKDLEIK